MNGRIRRMPGVSARRAAVGLTLIELMVAMVLGLLVVGAAIGIFVSNRQAYRATENLGEVQESLQMAFELMARDVREAAGNPCDIGLPQANVVTNPVPNATNWWVNWAQPLRGFDNGALPGSAAGTDAIQVLSVGDQVANVQSHAGTTLTVDNASGFAAGNILMVCDMRQVAIFRASATTATTIRHAGSNNCNGGNLNVAPAPCTGTAPYVYPQNSVVGRVDGVRWFVADNGRGGTSLFRSVNGGAREEMIEGVTDMQIDYLPGSASGAYVPAGAVADWASVTAVRISMTAQGIEQVGVGGTPLVRRLEHVVALRNRTI